MAQLATKTPSFRSEENGRTGVRPREVFFLAQSVLEANIRDGRATMDGSVLSVVSTGERYALRDAVRVLGPSGPGADVFGMTGKVVSVTELFSMGATLTAHSMRIGTVEYETQLGLLAQRLV